MADYCSHEHPQPENKPERCKDSCPATGYQHVAVSVPVAVIPYARAKEVRIHCKGRPVISPNETHCKGKKDGFCVFTLSQSFCVEIPVQFGASVDLGDTYVDCLGVASEHNTPNDSEELL